MAQIFNTGNFEDFKTVFRGRDDAFAVRWEKGGKSGYMPAYTFDPYMFKLHRAKGGTFQNYSNKQYKRLTDDQIIKHLEGEQLIGIYPLLKDNSSWFIAADFDEENWADECKQAITVFNEKGIPAYLERSRSGKGGHVWVFFESPYPAFRSRKIFISLLEQSGIFSIFDKHSSFDRLFPNQDYLSGKGLGNLIALPFHKISMEAGNSCFINPETLEPIEDQWKFLKTIKRISIEKLDSLYKELTVSSPINEAHIVLGKINICLKNAVYINRSGLTTPLINFLKEELNFANSEFFIKKKAGKNTWGTDRYFKMIEEAGNELIVPRGFAGKLIRFCKEQKIEYDLKDERKKLELVSFSPTIDLREYQKPALEATHKKDFGVIVAPPGSGKTIMGLSIIANKQQPALIIVHRKQLADQWADRIESFLGIPKREIGKIGQGKNIIGKQVTIATIQSLEKLIKTEQADKVVKSFGTIIVDECHHVPAETFRDAISKFHSFYLYGLTATPFRKYNDGKLIFIHLGDIISEVKPPHFEPTVAGAQIIVRNTGLSVPFNAKTDKFETLSKVLVHDSTRNELILKDVQAELNKGKKAVILTERKEHIDTLNQYLKQKYEAITISGEDSDSNKGTKWKALKEGNFQVLITTGQYFGEGTDLPKIECLFLVYPFSFEGKLIQYIGRVQRSEITPVIYDYRDYKIEYFEKLFQKRNVYYKKLYQLGSLFNQPAEDRNNPNTFLFEERLSIPIEQLEFRYGTVAFKYLIPEVNIESEFEVENTEICPEFAVLKPYFAKVLKTKKVKIDVQAKFHNGTPLFNTAKSNDLNKINRDILDSVKFQFVSKGIIGKAHYDNDNLLSLNQVQGNENGQEPLFNTEQELLNDILKNKDVKHYQQLVYLSQKHESSILKLRFVLSPFSFVFLLSGEKEYHIVWETLDTEEATYIWHIEKNLKSLKRKLQEIDTEIGKIRITGRQQYLGNSIANFSRMVHDYTDERKGFIIWKGLLEEMLG